MDADCLIKLTKSNLKELVCNNFSVSIPEAVKEETVDVAGDYPDAVIIQKNIGEGLVKVIAAHTSAEKGEDAVLTILKEEKFDAVCSDDKRFIKRLRLFEIPYITPVVFIAILLKRGKLPIKEAHKRLDLLSPYVSEAEFDTLKLVLDNWRTQ